MNSVEKSEGEVTPQTFVSWLVQNTEFGKAAFPVDVQLLVQTLQSHSFKFKKDKLTALMKRYSTKVTNKEDIEKMIREVK